MQRKEEWLAATVDDSARVRDGRSASSSSSFLISPPSSITDGARHPSSWKETAHIQQRPFGYSILAGVCVLICANAVLLPCIP